jgi:hypothetical protein
VAGAENGQNEKQGADQSGSELLKAQHQELQATLAKRSDANADRSAIVKEFAALWLPHQAVEEEVLVPALKNSGFDESKIVASEIRKDLINLLLADLLQDEDEESAEPRIEALAREFDALVEGHQANEESIRTAIEGAESESPSLSYRLETRYDRVKQRFADIDDNFEDALGMLALRRLSIPSARRRGRREGDASRYSHPRDRYQQGRFQHEGDSGYSRGTPERDEQGRFMSEGGSRSRGRYDDEDDRYSRRSMGRERDDEGRFVSDNGQSRSRFQGDDEHYGPRSLGSMGRDRDDEGRFARRGGGSEGRGHGGWSGDSEGHSEASRRGWDSPRHGESGWYGDSEGHSQASRRGWDDPRHGESGWYGDSEGHSEASRRGWEHGHEGNYRSRSSRYDDDDRRYDARRSSRYQDDDRDYDRGNGGRGHGGWSGDPEGHSEASRRGWQNRR